MSNFTPERVAAAVTALLTGYDAQQRDSANQYLLQLRQSPEGWMASIALLESQDDHHQMFGATMLHQKTTQDWTALTESQQIEIRGKIMSILQLHTRPGSSAAVAHKLAQTLAASSVRSKHGIRNLLDQLLPTAHRVAGGANVGPHLGMDMFLLAVLLALPDEALVARISASLAREAHASLFQSAPDVLRVLKTYLDHNLGLLAAASSSSSSSSSSPSSSSSSSPGAEKLDAAQEIQIVKRLVECAKTMEAWSAWKLAAFEFERAGLLQPLSAVLLQSGSQARLLERRSPLVRSILKLFTTLCDTELHEEAESDPAILGSREYQTSTARLCSALSDLRPLTEWLMDKVQKDDLDEDEEETFLAIARFAGAFGDKHFEFIAGPSQDGELVPFEKRFYVVQLLLKLISSRNEHASLVGADFFAQLNTIPMSDRPPQLRQPVFQELLRCLFQRFRLPEKFTGWREAEVAHAAQLGDHALHINIPDQLLPEAVEQYRGVWEDTLFDCVSVLGPQFPGTIGQCLQQQSRAEDPNRLWTAWEVGFWMCQAVGNRLLGPLLQHPEQLQDLQRIILQACSSSNNRSDRHHHSNGNPPPGGQLPAHPVLDTRKCQFIRAFADGIVSLQVRTLQQGPSGGGEMGNLLFGAFSVVLSCAGVTQEAGAAFEALAVSLSLEPQLQDLTPMIRALLEQLVRGLRSRDSSPEAVRRNLKEFLETEWRTPHAWQIGFLEGAARLLLLLPAQHPLTQPGIQEVFKGLLGPISELLTQVGAADSNQMAQVFGQMDLETRLALQNRLRLVGKFTGLSLFVDASTLDPRKEDEILTAHPFTPAWENLARPTLFRLAEALLIAGRHSPGVGGSPASSNVKACAGELCRVLSLSLQSLGESLRNHRSTFLPIGELCLGIFRVFRSAEALDCLVSLIDAMVPDSVLQQFLTPEQRRSVQQDTAQLQELLRRGLPDIQAQMLQPQQPQQQPQQQKPSPPVILEWMEKQPGNLVRAFFGLWGMCIRRIPETTLDGLLGVLELACHGGTLTRQRESLLSIFSFLDVLVFSQHPQAQEYVIRGAPHIVRSLLHACVGDMAVLGVSGHALEVLLELHLRCPEPTAEAVLRTAVEGKWFHPQQQQQHHQQQQQRNPEKILDAFRLAYAKIVAEFHATKQKLGPDAGVRSAVQQQQASPPGTPGGGRHSKPQLPDQSTRALLRVQRRLNALLKDVKGIRDGVQDPEVLMSYVL